MSLQWSKKNYGPMTWHEAVEFCKTLNEDGFTDWRLPTIQELHTLVNYEKYNPASDLDMLASDYWSSTGAYNTIVAWNMNFHYGYVYRRYKSSSYYVRAVRGEFPEQGGM